MISDDSDIGGDERINSCILYNVTDKCMYYEVEEVITVGIKQPSALSRYFWIQEVYQKIYTNSLVILVKSFMFLFSLFLRDKALQLYKFFV